MHFNVFCRFHKCTKEEKQLLAEYLAFLRMRETLKLYGAK